MTHRGKNFNPLWCELGERIDNSGVENKAVGGDGEVYLWSKSDSRGTEQKETGSDAEWCPWRK